MCEKIQKLNTERDIIPKCFMNSFAIYEMIIKYRSVKGFKICFITNYGGLSLVIYEKRECKADKSYIKYHYQAKKM